jgi:hypothetical protein
VSFAAITLCAASQRVFILVVVVFRYDSVRKLLDTPSYDCILGYKAYTRKLLHRFSRQCVADGLGKLFLVTSVLLFLLWVSLVKNFTGKTVIYWAEV